VSDILQLLQDQAKAAETAYFEHRRKHQPEDGTPMHILAARESGQLWRKWQDLKRRAEASATYHAQQEAPSHG
jgi:hypothetical protein